MSTCLTDGKTRYFYTGNEVGDFNFTGDYNFVAGGLDGSGISAGTIVAKFFKDPANRSLWLNHDASLSQEFLNATYPFILFNWIVDIYLNNEIFRFSDKNVYVRDKENKPRFYEARCGKGSSISINTGEWLSPHFQFSDFTLTINNRDGRFNDYLPNGIKYKNWINSKVEVRIGFGEKFENYFLVFEGYISSKQGVTCTDTDITIKAIDFFERDNIPIPPLVFNEINYPYLDDDVKGKSVPLIYGDWTDNVSPYGSIQAYCLNAKETNPSYYIFKVSYNALEDIGQIYLQRGNRKEDTPDGAVAFDMTQITLFKDRGEFIIPTQIPVLKEEVLVYDKGKAGSGSGLDLLTSDSADVNFILKNVKAGDKVVQTKTSLTATILAVTSNQLVLTGGVIFSEGDEYSIRTTNYTFIKGDKITLFCKGKNIKQVSKLRLGDIGLGYVKPEYLTIDLNGTFYFCDNDLKKIFNCDFKGNILKIIDYSSISSEINVIAGIAIQTDNTLWIFEKNLSKFYRFVLNANNLGLSFKTDIVQGLGVLLNNVSGLAIDSDNRLYICDNTSGNFYVIDPFTPFAPTLIHSFNKNVFDTNAIEITDISVDVNANELIVTDRATQKFYRVNKTNGNLISSENINVIDTSASWISGLSYAQDGTLFFLEKSLLTIFNYNEFQTANTNAGFIVKDMVQSFTGKTYNDFDLEFNNTCRQSLSQYKCRFYLNENKNLTDVVDNLLKQFNAQIFIKHNKISLFQINFNNFKISTRKISTNDIIHKSFRATKEFNQYFNSVSCSYNYLPASNRSTTSDTYISPSGIMAAKKEITKKLELPNVYKREDIDKLLPLFLKLAVAEPEFLEFEAGFRLILTQLYDFFVFNHFEKTDCNTGLARGGRRFKDVPCFVRSINFNLDKFSVKLKLWSLASTQFGSYVPASKEIVGGQFDKIILTNLGVIGRISPIGIIINSGSNFIELQDVNGMDAEHRIEGSIKAWDSGYLIDIVDKDGNVIETNEILNVSGSVITMKNNFTNTILNSVVNSDGIIEGGHYIKHSSYNFASLQQKKSFAFLSLPQSSYPSSSALEIDEQRSGLHSLPDNRPPYVLYPFTFTESV
jgi:hypothetical protein